MKLISYLSLTSTIVVVIIGVLQWKRLEKLKLLLWAVSSSAIADIMSAILSSYGIYTWWIANIFVIFHFAFLFKLISNNLELVFFIILFYGCIAFSVYNFFFLETPNTFNTNTAYVTGILMITLILQFFYKVITAAPNEKAQTAPLFWLALGALIYYGGTLFIYLFNNYLIVRLPASHQSIWLLHNFLNITKNAFFFAAIWVNYKNKTSPQ